MKLTKFPKVNIIHCFTPLEELLQLREILSCNPRIFIKRDDTTTVGLGGNKNRKLQYVMADALKKGADTIITAGGIQSNHCRQTLAFAKHLGMDCHLVLTGDEPAFRQGNCIIFTIMGGKLYFIGAKEDPSSEMHAIAEELSKKGRKPYIIPIGASIPLGSLGYIECVMEIVDQAKSVGVNFEHCFIATGSCGTQAGLEVGVRELYPAMQIHGVSVNLDSHSQQKKIADIANGVFKLLGISKKTIPSNFTVHDEYIGEGYAIPTKEANNAISLIAENEGLLLDPVYTGKAMACMIDYLKKGALNEADAVLFIHTGGSPALFAMAEVFQPYES